eukprot:476533_1
MAQLQVWNIGVYTTVLCMFPIGCFCLIILQVISDSYFGNHHSDDYEESKSQRNNRKLLYIIYGTGLVCGVLGVSLHANTMPEWCEKYGLLPCFCFLGLSKAVLYSFFLLRAEAAQGMTLTKCKTIVFRYVAPVYLFIYWIIYMVLTSMVFGGKLVDDQLSHCVFSRGSWLFSIVAACFDMINALGSLALFIHPLIRTIQQAGLSQSDRKEYLQFLGFVTAMKWNIVLTTIAAASSMAAVLSFYEAKEYAWFFCTGDPFINAFCTFLMLGPNRRMVKFMCCRRCSSDQSVHQEACQYVMEIDGIVVQMGRNETPAVNGVDKKSDVDSDRYQSDHGKEKATTVTSIEIETTANVQSDGKN